MTKKTCPLCKKDLSLKQVNLNLAVYICEDLKCSYPVGSECIVVERKLEDMDKELDMMDQPEEDFNNWVEEAATTNETTNSVEVNPPPTNQDSIEWIDDLVEETVNEARCNPEVPLMDTDFDDILNFMFTE